MGEQTVAQKTSQGHTECRYPTIPTGRKARIFPLHPNAPRISQGHQPYQQKNHLKSIFQDSCLIANKQLRLQKVLKKQQSLSILAHFLLFLLVFQTLTDWWCRKEALLPHHTRANSDPSFEVTSPFALLFFSSCIIFHACLFSIRNSLFISELWKNQVISAIHTFKLDSTSQLSRDKLRLIALSP